MSGSVCITETIQKRNLHDGIHGDHLRGIFGQSAVCGSRSLESPTAKSITESVRLLESAKKIYGVRASLRKSLFV
jgi:hypothetical protein